MTAPGVTRARRVADMQDAAAAHLNQLWRQYCQAAQRGETATCTALERPLAAARIHLATLTGALA